MLKFLCFGGAHVQSALDEFTITTDEACPVSPAEVYNALGMAQADTWADGTATPEPLKIDGHPLMVRREGWRLRVWSPEAEPPPADPLPPPSDAHTGTRPPARVNLVGEVMFPEDPKIAPESVQNFVVTLHTAREFVPADLGSYDGLRAEIERIAALANHPSDDAPPQRLSPSLTLMMRPRGRIESDARSMGEAADWVKRALGAAAVMQHRRRIEIVRDVVAVQRYIEGEVERHRIAVRREMLAQKARAIFTLLGTLAVWGLLELLRPYLDQLRQRLVEGRDAWHSATHPGPAHNFDGIVLDASARTVVERLRALLETVLAEWDELFSLFPWDSDEFVTISKRSAEWMVEGLGRLLAPNEAQAAPPVEVKHARRPTTGEDEAIWREMSSALSAVKRALWYCEKAGNIDTREGYARSTSVWDVRDTFKALAASLQTRCVARWGGEMMLSESQPVMEVPTVRSAIVLARASVAACTLGWDEYPGPLPEIIEEARRLIDAALLRVDGVALTLTDLEPALTEPQLRAAREAARALDHASVCVGDAEHLSRSEMELVVARAREAIMAARVVVIDDVLKQAHYEPETETARMMRSRSAREGLNRAHDALTRWVDAHVECAQPWQRAPDAAARAVLCALVAVDRALLAQPEARSVRRTLGRLLGRLASAVSP